MKVELDKTYPPFGKVAALGVIGGERYCWLIDKHDCVTMIPCEVIEMMEDEQ